MRSLILASAILILGGAGPAGAQPLPDNPCELLTTAELSTITDLKVIESRRVPSIRKIVDAQREAREPGPGTICQFETDSPFGEILISLPPRPERRAEVYWEARSRYFKTFPGSAQHIAGLGLDAWSSGGTSLSVLVSDDDYLMLSTQMYQPRSRQLLVDIARAILRGR
jgi:hypothetical protein